MTKKNAQGIHKVIEQYLQTSALLFLQFNAVGFGDSTD